MKTYMCMFVQKVSTGYLKGCEMNEVFGDEMLVCLKVLYRGTIAQRVYQWSGLSNKNIIFSKLK